MPLAAGLMVVVVGVGAQKVQDVAAAEKDGEGEVCEGDDCFGGHCCRGDVVSMGLWLN